jgi:hypothetical protein
MKTIISIFLLSICNILHAQDKDYTSFIKSNFPKTHAVIYSESVKEWPGDYEMQAYRIRNQCNALNEYIQLSLTQTSIPSTVLKGIKQKSLIEWSKNTNTGTTCDILAGIPRLDCIYSILNADWEMVIYTVNNQIEAYESL